VLDQCAITRFDGFLSNGVPQSFNAYQTLKVYGYHVRRDKLDTGLVECARKAGAQVCFDAAISGVIFDKHRVNGVRTRGHKEFFARNIVDATGYARSLLRRLDAFDRTASPPLTVRTGIIDVTAGYDHKYMHTRFESRADGWTWCTPATGNRVTWTGVHVRGACSPAIVDLTHQSMPGSVRIANATWRLARPLAVNGVLAAGEAGGRLDPASGLGVVDALESGIMAGLAVVDSAASPALEPWIHAEYDAWFAARHEQGAAELAHYYLQQGIQILGPG
jgi:flavin-dependent dehydrogenase